MLASSSAVTSQPALLKGFPHDFGKDVTAVTTLVQGRTAAVVNASSPYRTIDDLVAYMKANPGKVNVGVTSSIDVFQVSVFGRATGTVFEQVRYPSELQAQSALIAGGIHVILGAGIPLAKPHVDAGKLRFISVNGSERDRLIPQVPAVAESPSPQVRELAKSVLYAPFWLGIMVSSKVPKEAVNTLYAATREVMKDSEIVQRMQALGLEVVPNPPPPEQATAAFINGAAEFSRVAKDAGVQPQ
ncbi:MAG TPA: tripartite tricarboxylate transporter substrate-binding protein [Ramlibacter sp.]|nr:tripartite tricarboxylate transporter substrate-binding protein [Ramlibacter sp.]